MHCRATKAQRDLSDGASSRKVGQYFDKHLGRLRNITKLEVSRLSVSRAGC